MRILFGVLLAACVAGSAEAKPAPRRETPLDAVLRRVAAQTREPSAAEFQGAVMQTWPSGNTTVCGEMNGKNAFGGYTGFQPFVALVYPNSGTVSVAQSDGTYRSSQAILAMCREPR